MNEEKLKTMEEEVNEELYHKYIGKYEKKEEEIEEEEEEIIEEVPEYSDEQIDEFCSMLKENMLKDKLNPSNASIKLAKKIATNSKEYLDNNTYLWTMYTYAMKYRNKGYFNAEKYCFMRMRDVVDAMMNKREEQKALTFVKSTITEEMQKEILDQTSFLNDNDKIVTKKTIQMEVVMVLAIVLLMKGVFKFSLTTVALFAVAVIYLAHKYTKKMLKTSLINAQLLMYKNEDLEEEILSFDAPVKNS